MRRDYNPASSLDPVFVVPYRIVDLSDFGAVLKDPRNGDIMSVHFQNLRKLNMEEFVSLLPSNFDKDILRSLNMHRYNTHGDPDKCKKTDDSKNFADNDNFADNNNFC
jgi:hypothetical protein